jgi:hypothetical protein
MRVTGTAQREASVAQRMPPVEEVRPGLWSVPVPIPVQPTALHPVLPHHG